MSKYIAKIIWTALALVGVVLIFALAVLGVWKVIDLIREGLGPTPPRIDVVLERIEHVNKQIFIQHNISVHIEYKDVPVILPNLLERLGVKQEFLVLLWGRVPAGFDLQQLDKDDIWISADGKRIQLTLPPPTVFEDNVSIDFDKSRIFFCRDTCPDFLCENPLPVYHEQILPGALDRMVETAYQYAILEQAASDGKDYYEQFLKSMGFEEVQVIVTGYTP